MASEILGLFGKTPAQIRQEQFDSMMVSPTQTGSQGLLQQVVSMGRNAGSAAGGMAGRMMGGMAPGEREAMVMQDVMQQVGQDPNMTQAERLRKMAEIVSQQPGMGDQALKLQAAANQLEAQKMKIDEAKFKQANRFEDRKETRMVSDGYGGFVPKQFYWTEKYNEQTGKWEKMTAPSETPPPAAGGGGGGEDKNALDAEAERRAKEKAGETQGGATTPESVNDLVNASTSNVDMAALEKQAQADRANAAYETEAKEISSLYQLTPAVIAGLTRQQAIAAFRKYKKNLTKEQTDAILEKAGARRTQFR